MAYKSGSSHALSTLLLTLAGATLVKYLSHVQLFDWLFGYLSRLAGLIADLFHLLLMVELPTEFIEYVLLGSMLSFVWGVVYHIKRAEPMDNL